MNNKIIAIGFVGIVLIIVLIIIYNNKANENKLHGTPIAPVEKLIGSLFFNQGTYTEYKSLFANESRVISESQFNEYKSKNKPEMTFPKDYSSVASIMKNMKQKQTDPNTVIVYWPVDPQETAENARVKWTVIKQNGKWFIRN